MENNGLIKIWKEGNQEILKNKRFQRSELEAFLKPKINKTTLSLKFNIFFYMITQVAAMVLIGIGLYGYRSNPVILNVLIPMLIACSSFFGYGVFLLSCIWQINHGSFDLVTAVNRKLKVYRTHYEAWMWIGTVTTLCLIFALGILVDYDGGNFRINKPVFFTGMCLLVILFIYGSQKVGQFFALRQIRFYLEDLQNDVLEKSSRLEKEKRKYMLFILIVTLILTLTFIWGLIKARGY
jgi:hypothetical protein